MNIAKILKNCPKGIRLYSPIVGDVFFEEITEHGCIRVESVVGNRVLYLYDDGKEVTSGECMLFPSKENRDWNKFGTEERRFRPYQKVIVRADKDCKWFPTFYGYYDTKGSKHLTGEGSVYDAENILPFDDNEDKVGKVTD